VAGDLIGGYHVRADRCFVVPNPVFRSLDLIKSEGRVSEPREAINDRQISLTYVGRIVPQKQPLRFVEVLAELVNRGWDARGVVFGAGPLSDLMGEEAKRRGVDLQFDGWHEDWPDRLHSDSCVLLCSVVEGLANVAIEAASVAIPVVASSRALGVGDAIVSGITGEVALTDSVSDLASSVERAMSTPLNVPALRWLEKWTSERSVDALEKVFQAAIGRRI
jgi:glycosyltransferase involved in cell wall biosynthesis